MNNSDRGGSVNVSVLLLPYKQPAQRANLLGVHSLGF